MEGTRYESIFPSTNPAAYDDVVRAVIQTVRPVLRQGSARNYLAEDPGFSLAAFAARKLDGFHLLVPASRSGHSNERRLTPLDLNVISARDHACQSSARAQFAAFGASAWLEYITGWWPTVASCRAPLQR
jgi:hypothetical protein